MGWRHRFGVGVLVIGGFSGGEAAVAQTMAPAAVPEAAESVQAGRDASADSAIATANLRWDDRGYGFRNGWWPPGYGEPRPWRPRSYAVRPYWQEPRGAWGWRQPYPRWPETRSGSTWVPRYGWPRDGRPYEYPRTWDRYRYRYGNRYEYGYGTAPPWRYDGYIARWSRVDERR